jgi:hypothetical protein
MSNRSAAAVEDSKTFIIVCSSVAFIAGLSTTLWMAIGRRPSIRKTLIGQSMGAHQSAFKDALKAFGFGTALCASGAVSLTYITRSVCGIDSVCKFILCK